MLQSRGISMYVKKKLPKGSDIIIVSSWKHPEWNDKFANVIDRGCNATRINSFFLEEHKSVKDKLEFGLFAFEYHIDPLFCGYCGKTEEEVGHKLKPCKGCGGMKDCQKMDWKRKIYSSLLILIPLLTSVLFVMLDYCFYFKTGIYCKI